MYSDSSARYVYDECGQGRIAEPILCPCVQLVSVQDVKMIKDRSKKFKGFVYVELGTTEDVFKAVQVGRK